MHVAVRNCVLSSVVVELKALLQSMVQLGDRHTLLCTTVLILQRPAPRPARDGVGRHLAAHLRPRRVFARHHVTDSTNADASIHRFVNPLPRRRYRDAPFPLWTRRRAVQLVVVANLVELLAFRMGKRDRHKMERFAIRLANVRLDPPLVVSYEIDVACRLLRYLP